MNQFISYQDFKRKEIIDEFSKFEENLENMHISHVLENLNYETQSLKILNKELESLFPNKMSKQSKKYFDDNEYYLDEDFLDDREYMNSSLGYDEIKKISQYDPSHEIIMEMKFTKAKIDLLFKKAAQLEDGNPNILLNIVKFFPFNKEYSDISVLNYFIKNPTDLIDVYDIVANAYPNFPNLNIVDLFDEHLPKASLKEIKTISNYFLKHATFPNKKLEELIVCSTLHYNPLAFFNLANSKQSNQTYIYETISANVLDNFRTLMNREANNKSLQDYLVADQRTTFDFNLFFSNFFKNTIDVNKESPESIISICLKNKCAAQYISKIIDVNHQIFQPKNEQHLFSLLKEQTYFVEKTPLTFWKTHLYRLVSLNTAIFYELPSEVKSDATIILKLEYQLYLEKQYDHPLFKTSQHYRKIPLESNIECLKMLQEEIDRIDEDYQNFDFMERRTFLSKYPLNTQFNNLGIILRNFDKEFLQDTQNKEIRDIIIKVTNDLISFVEKNLNINNGNSSSNNVKISDDNLINSSNGLAPVLVIQIFKTLSLFPHDEIQSIVENSTISCNDIVFAANESSMSNSEVDSLFSFLQNYLKNKSQEEYFDILDLHKQISINPILSNIIQPTSLNNCVDLISLIPSGNLQDFKASDNNYLFSKLYIDELKNNQQAAEFLIAETLKHQFSLDLSNTEVAPKTARKVKF